MALKIIGAIGNGIYDVLDVKYNEEYIVKYERDEKEVIGSPYSLITILHYLNKYEPELVKDGVEFAICTTEEAENVHLNEEYKNAVRESDKALELSRYLNLRAEIDYYNKNNVFEFPIRFKKIDIQHNYNDDDKWDFFNVIYEYLNESSPNDRVIIDLTAGNRTFPTMIMLTTNFYESIFSYDIVKGVFYVNAQEKKLVNLSDMYLITKWANAINSLLYAGSYRHYHELIEDMKSKYSNHELFESIKEISYQLEEVADALKLMKIGFYMNFNPRLNFKYFATYKIVNLIDKIQKFKLTYKENSQSQEIILILRTLESIEKQFDWIKLNFDTTNDEVIREYLNRNYYIHIYHLLKYYQENEMYQQAITVIKEVLFPFDIRKNPPIIGGFFQPQSKKTRKQVNLAAKYYTKLHHLVHLYISQENQEQLKGFYDKLIEFHDWRNKINHAFQIYIDFSKSKVDKAIEEKYADNKINSVIEEDDFNQLKKIMDKNDDRTNQELVEFLNANDEYIKSFAYKLNEIHNSLVDEMNL